MDAVATGALVVAGLALLMLGGELVVRGSVGAARRLEVPPVIVGVVLMGFGTSLPELVTSVDAALLGAPGLSLGNVVGSNIANVLLIAGVAAAIAGTARTRRLLRRDGVVLAVSTALFTLLAYLDAIAFWTGLLMLGGLALYLTASVLAASQTGALDPEVAKQLAEVGDPPSMAVCLGLFAAGLVATVFGADFLVTGAIDIARALGATEALIGVTIVAIGTSLPELAATLSAARRGQQEMAIGNVFGSNIFNTLGIVGATAVVAPLPSEQIVGFDLWAMCGATVVILWFAHSHAQLSRGEGVTLLAGYVSFLIATILLSGALS